MRRSFLQKDSIAIVFAQFSSGLDLLQRNCRDAWLWFDRACSQVEVLMKEQPFPLVERLIYHFESQRWAGYNEVRTALLHFIAAMARKCLAPGDTLAEMMSMLSRDNTIDAVMPKLSSLLQAVLANRVCILKRRHRPWRLYRRLHPRLKAEKNVDLSYYRPDCRPAE